MDKSYPEWKGHPPTRATLSEPPFHTFPYKTRRTVYMHKKLKIGSAGRVTRVNILWWYSGIPSRANFSRYKHFGLPSAGSTRWRRDNQSMRERCWFGQRGKRYFSYKRSLKFARLGGWPFFSRRTSFLHLNGTQVSEILYNLPRKRFPSTGNRRQPLLSKAKICKKTRKWWDNSVLCPCKKCIFL